MEADEMAEMTNVRLEVHPDSQTQTARVLVKCDLHFEDRELQIMERNPGLVYFQLFCRLLGKDLGRPSDKVPYLDTDDWIYTYATQFFPDETLSPVESVCFDARLGSQLLNEDLIGGDEVYAQLVLRGRYRFGDCLLVKNTCPCRV
jgi:hypothetical protein